MFSFLNFFNSYCEYITKDEIAESFKLLNFKHSNENEKGLKINSNRIHQVVNCIFINENKSYKIHKKLLSSKVIEKSKIY